MLHENSLICYLASLVHTHSTLNSDYVVLALARLVGIFSVHTHIPRHSHLVTRTHISSRVCVHVWIAECLSITVFFFVCVAMCVRVVFCLNNSRRRRRRGARGPHPPRVNRT